MARRASLCILEHDGMLLRGYVVSVGRDGTVHVARRAVSRLVEPDVAVADVVARLRAAGRVPRRALFVTAEAVAAVVRLPLPAGRARAPAEMTQMIRWELEPVFAQRGAARPLGAILVGRGDLTPAQVRTVVAAQEQRRAGREAARFGEVACSLGLLDDARLREALGVQQRLAAPPDAEHACGWAGQAGVPGDARSPWLVAGLPRAARDAWRDRFGRQGLRLAGIYPLPGSAAAAVDAPDTALLETHPGVLACVARRAGGVVACEVVALGPDEPVAEVARDLLVATGTREALVAGPGAADLAAQLPDVATLLDAPVTGTDDAPALAGVAGAARHAAGVTAGAACVPARDPGPPLRQRPAAWWTAAAAAAILLVLAAEWAAASARRAAEDDLAAVQGPWRRVEAELKVQQRASRRAEELRERIDATGAELATVKARLARLESGLDARAHFVPGVLGALAQAASDEIVLGRVVEERPGAVRIEGWALSERAVQIFARATAARLRPLRVTDQSARAETVRGGAVRYAFGLTLAPPDAEDNP